MRKWIVALIILVPILEFWGYVEVASRIGVGKTIIVTLATSIIGGLMMQFEGRNVAIDAKAQMNNGQVPGRMMLDGLCVFAGGILLVLPGFFTDLIGFLLVFPVTRPLLRTLIMKWIGRKIKDGTFTIYRR